MRIAVVGTGYIGLVTGVCLAKLGHQVVCVDRDARKISTLQCGESPIFEPGLTDLMQDAIAAGALRFSTDTTQTTRDSEAVIIAVGTPIAADSQKSDLSFVLDAARDIASGINAYKVIIVKSTVPMGTGRRIASAIKAAYPMADFDVVSSPEFLREGAAVQDFMNPDRIVIGTESVRARAVLAELFDHFLQRGVFIQYTDLESSELIKFASNSFLATKIAFINEMAELCEEVGANVQDVAKGMGLDERIGSKFLNAGPGFGGSCFPKDNRAMTAMAQDVGINLRITDAVIASNEHSKNRVVSKVKEMAGGNVADLTIVVFGVTFKPDTDDMRDAPSLTIVPALLSAGARIVVVDPEGRKFGEGLLPGVRWEHDPYVAAHNADMIVVLTEWSVFKTVDIKRLRASMRHAVMADFRSIYDISALKAAGFERCYQIGRG